MGLGLSLYNPHALSAYYRGPSAFQVEFVGLAIRGWSMGFGAQAVGFRG